ncbi:hypothetical protein Tco_0064827 [Tanacetum coccineum]
MTTQRRLSRWLVKVSLKYGDTICALNEKKLDQSADEDENQNFWNMIIQSEGNNNSKVNVTTTVPVDDSPSKMCRSGNMSRSVTS